jgi:Flp pilus assembly protein CpaB
MTLTLELTPEQSERVTLAEESGMNVNAMLRGLIDTLPSKKDDFAYAQRQPTVEELEILLDELAMGGEEFPVLPDEAYRRENIYEERI